MTGVLSRRARSIATRQDSGEPWNAFGTSALLLKRRRHACLVEYTRRRRRKRTSTTRWVGSVVFVFGSVVLFQFFNHGFEDVGLVVDDTGKRLVESLPLVFD